MATRQRNLIKYCDGIDQVNTKSSNDLEKAEVELVFRSETLADLLHKTGQIDDLKVSKRIKDGASIFCNFEDIQVRENGVWISATEHFISLKDAAEEMIKVINGQTLGWQKAHPSIMKAYYLLKGTL